jgi:hypothetical protein
MRCVDVSRNDEMAVRGNADRSGHGRGSL